MTKEQLDALRDWIRAEAVAAVYEDRADHGHDDDAKELYDEIAAVAREKVDHLLLDPIYHGLTGKP